MRTSRELVERYYTLMDEGRLAGCEELFHPDAELRIAHHPPLRGWDTILAAMTAALSIATITHDVGRVWDVEPGTAIVEVSATYRFADGRVVDVPGMVVATIADGRFRKQRVYADLSTVLGG